MTFKGFAESSARGFKTFQIQLPTKEVLANMKQASDTELGYKKEDLQTYKEHRREYLTQLNKNHNQQSQNLKDRIDFRNENIADVQKWEMKRWQDKVDKARNRVNRIGQYGQQNPSPSTLESIAGVLGDFAPKLGAMIQEQKVAEAKAERTFIMQFYANTGLTTKHQNEITANIDAILRQDSQGIEIRKRINEELGLTGPRAITVEQMARISKLSGMSQLLADQMLAHNAIQKYPLWFQSKLNIPLSELGLEGYSEGETAAQVLDPNLGMDHERASNMMTQLRSLFMNDAELGNPGDLPLSLQGHSMFEALRKHDNKILADYGRGVSKIIHQNHVVQIDQAIQGAWYNGRLQEVGVPNAMVELRDKFAKDWDHMPGGGNTFANGLIYDWYRKNIELGLVSEQDIIAFSRAMAAKYPDKWVGQGWPEKFRQLAADARHHRHSQAVKIDQQQRFSVKMLEKNWNEFLDANPDLGDLTTQELRDKLTRNGIPEDVAGRLTTRTLRGVPTKAGSEYTAEQGNRLIGLQDGIASLIIVRHGEQNGSTILKPNDLTGKEPTKRFMMDHAKGMTELHYNAEFSQSRDHTKAWQYALGKLKESIASGFYDLSPNKHTVDGKEQQRTRADDFKWLKAPEDTTQLSTGKSTVIMKLPELRNKSTEEYIKAVTAPGFIPNEVVKGTIGRNNVKSLTAFMNHPAAIAVKESGSPDITWAYLYSKVLEAHGYEPLSQDEYLDPKEYRESSQGIKDRLKAMDAVPPSSRYEDVTGASIGYGLTKMGATTAAVDPNLGAPPKLPTIHEYPGQTNNAKAMVQTIIDVEAGGPWKFHRFVGPDKPKYRAPLDRMTVQEVYNTAYYNPDGSKSSLFSGTLPQRLGGGTIRYGADSHAAGAGQFHPDTMMSVIQSMGLNPETTYFTPELQLQMILQHAQNLGADVNGGYTQRLHSIIGSSAAWQGVRNHSYAAMKQKYENNLRKLQTKPQNTEIKMRTWNNPYQNPAYLKGMV